MAFHLAPLTGEVLSYNLEEISSSLNVLHVFISKVFIEYLLTIVLVDIIHIVNAMR